MQAGKLDQQVSLQSLTETNNKGDVLQSWTPVAVVWASVISQRGDESFQAARNNARQTIRVQMRYRDDVKESWRLIWDNQPYNIKYVDRSQARQGALWVTAEAEHLQ